jgi:hypothetical protein
LESIDGTNQGASINILFISSSGNFFVSGRKAQKKRAFVKFVTQNRMKNFQPTATIATDVTCPIIVLNAKETIAAMPTPFDLVFVSKISAGMIHESGPVVEPKAN